MFRGLAGAWVLLSTGGLAAGLSGEVTVVGNVTAARCEVIAPNDGIYDLGRIAVAEKAAGPMALPPVTRTWRVQCDNPTYLAVVPQDNRAGAARGAGSAEFGLGDERGKALGYFRLGVSRVLIDQAAVAAQTLGQPMSGAGITPLLAGTRTRWLMSDNTARAGQTFAADITVFPWLTMPERAVTDRVVFDGSVTLNFIFGL